MPVAPNFNKLWLHFTDRAKPRPLDIIPSRFIQLFLDHGVESSQIPRVLPTIRLSDLVSPERLLISLTPETLDQTAELFGVSVQWLEGVGDEIYDYCHCYKHPERLLKHLGSLPKPKDDDILDFPLQVLTTTDYLDYADPRQQLLAPVLVEKIAELGDENIYRYHVYRDGFDWGYEPTRIQLKAMVRLVFQAIGPVPLFIISPSEMKDLLDGKIIPRKLLDGCLITEPSLEDYALAKHESAKAKETAELPAVLRYIEEHNLQDFSFARAEEAPAAAEQPECPPAPAELESRTPGALKKNTGKRAESEADWEAVRNVARALWAENDQLSITEVVKRIKAKPIFRASAFSESAIRKHIADLAPPHIRGKAGRKPKKSA